MSSTDDDLPFVKRSGIAVGHAVERHLINEVDGAGSFRTRFRISADGREVTRMRTKDGMPEVVTERTGGEAEEDFGMCFLGIPRDNTNTEGYSPTGDDRITHICKTVGRNSFDYPHTYASAGPHKFVPYTAKTIGPMTWWSKDIATRDKRPVVVSWQGCNGTRALRPPDIKLPHSNPLYGVLQKWPHEDKILAPAVWVNGYKIDLGSYLPGGWGVLSAALRKDSDGWKLLVVTVHSTDGLPAVPRIYTLKATAPLRNGKRFSKVKVTGVDTYVTLSGLPNTLNATCAPPFFNKSATKCVWVQSAGVSSGFAAAGELDVATGVFTAISIVANIPSGSPQYGGVLLAMDYVDDTLNYIVGVGYDTVADTETTGTTGAYHPSITITGTYNPAACDANADCTWVNASDPYDKTKVASQRGEFKIIKMPSGEAVYTLPRLSQYTTHGRAGQSSAPEPVTAHLDKWYADGVCHTVQTPDRVTMSFANFQEATGISTLTGAVQSTAMLACDVRADVYVIHSKFQEYVYSTTYTSTVTWSVDAPIYFGSPINPAYFSPVGWPDAVSSGSFIEDYTSDDVTRIVTVVGQSTTYTHDERTRTMNVHRVTPGAYSFSYAVTDETSHLATGDPVPTTVYPVSCVGDAASFGVLVPTLCAASSDYKRAFTQVMWPAKGFSELRFFKTDPATHEVLSSSLVSVRYSPGADSAISGGVFLPLWGKFA